MFTGECYVRGELLQGDNWISVDCKQPGVICKGSDGGVIGSGQVGGKDQVEKGSRSLPCGTPDSVPRDRWSMSCCT